MKKCIFIAIFLLIAYNSKSEVVDTLKPYLFIGGYAGLNYNMHNADFRELPGVPNCCPKFESGSGLGFHFGGLLRYPLDEQFSLGLNLGYITLNGKLQKDEIIGNTEIRDANPPYETTEIVDAVSNHSVDGNFSAVNIEPRFIWNFFSAFRWNIGLNFGFLTTAQFSQREKLIQPNNIVFTSTGTLVRNEYNNVDLQNKNSFQIFGKTSLGYEFNFGKDMLLVPEIGIAIPFTNLYSGSWKVTPINLTLALEIPLKHSAPKDTIFETNYRRDTLIVSNFGINKESVELISSEAKVSKVEKSDHFLSTTTIYENYQKNVPKYAGISGDLYISGMDESGNLQPNPTITIEEIEVSESFPLLPYIFFKENNRNRSESSINTDVANSQSFTYSGLPWETMGIYDNLLNIIKYRMDKYPDARIKITGTNNNTSELNNLALSKARAENVKNYAVDDLKISPDRIDVASQNLPDKPSNTSIPDGIQENQRAEISSKNLDILAPVELSQIEKRSNPPVVQLSPEISSTVPIKNWNLSIKQNGNEIRNYSGTGLPKKQLWIVAEQPIPLYETPIDIKFNATDSLGNPLEIQNKLNIAQKTIKKKREEIKNDTIYQRYSLIVFDFDKSELNQNHKAILDKIKDKIKSNSIVTIYGYADRTGTSQYNKDLATKRIDEVAKYLRLVPDSVKKYPVGSEELIFDNNSPEGRSYSRTVKIIIATPIK